MRGPARRIAGCLVSCIAAMLACLALPASSRAQPAGPLVNPVGPGAGAVTADGAAAADGPLPADANIDAVLDALDERGKNLRDFTAEVTLTTTDPTVMDEYSRSGHVVFRNAGADNPDAKLRVTFDAKRSGSIKTAEKLEYLLAGGWLWDRDYKKQIEIKRQVLKPGQKLNLLKLGEGPFPLPIGQDRAEVLKQFVVEKLAPSRDDDPRGVATIHLKLTPKADTRLAKRFATIDVWVDLKSKMPAQIQAAETASGMIRTTNLNNVKVNQGVADEQFQLPQVQGWQQRQEPYAE